MSQSGNAWILMSHLTQRSQTLAECWKILEALTRVRNLLLYQWYRWEPHLMLDHGLMLTMVQQEQQWTHNFPLFDNTKIKVTYMSKNLWVTKLLNRNINVFIVEKSMNTRKKCQHSKPGKLFSSKDLLKNSVLKGQSSHLQRANERVLKSSKSVTNRMNSRK